MNRIKIKKIVKSASFFLPSSIPYGMVNINRWSAIIAFFLFNLSFIVSYGQSNLNRYINEGLTSNEAVKQHQFSLQKSTFALKEAKTLFLPTVSLNTTYSLAQGGRTITLPLGDLLNSAYTSLNQLTNTTNFSQVTNQTVLFNPNNYYDAKFRTTMPLINLELEYNRRIKRQQVTIQEIELDLYKRELVKEIKTAYFKCMQAAEAIKIYQTALKLVEENQRINTSLFKSDKVNRTTVIRSESEVSKYKSLIEVALQNEKSSRAYFNFLLNRDVVSPIELDNISQLPQEAILQDTSTVAREELKKLAVAAAISHEVVSLTKAATLPKLNTFLDLGSQGFNGEFNNKTQYYFFGVSLQWELFSFGKNRYKTEQTKLDNQIVSSQTLYVQEQLKLQIAISYNAFLSSVSQYHSSLSQQGSSEKFYEDMLKLYKGGQALFIELLDAQNQLITTQLQTSIALFDAWTKAAEVERANASFNLK